MNARAVGRLSGRTISQMTASVRQWQARLVTAARTLANPGATVLIRGDGTELSAQQRLEAITHHWDEHVKELQSASAA